MTRSHAARGLLAALGVVIGNACAWVESLSSNDLEPMAGRLLADFREKRAQLAPLEAEGEITLDEAGQEPLICRIHLAIPSPDEMTLTVRDRDGEPLVEAEIIYPKAVITWPGLEEPVRLDLEPGRAVLIERLRRLDLSLVAHMLLPSNAHAPAPDILPTTTESHAARYRLYRHGREIGELTLNADSAALRELTLRGEHHEDLSRVLADQYLDLGAGFFPTRYQARIHHESGIRRWTLRLETVRFAGERFVAPAVDADVPPPPPAGAAAAPSSRAPVRVAEPEDLFSRKRVPLSPPSDSPRERR